MLWLGAVSVDVSTTTTLITAATPTFRAPEKSRSATTTSATSLTLGKGLWAAGVNVIPKKSFNQNKSQQQQNNN